MEQITKPDMTQFYNTRYYNYVDYTILEFLKNLNVKGIAEWDYKTQYIANKSYVQGLDGKIYVAITNSEGASPSTSPTDWKLFSGGGEPTKLPTGTDRQVMGFDREGNAEAITIGWEQLSDLAEKPPFDKGALVFMSDEHTEWLQGWVEVATEPTNNTFVLRKPDTPSNGGGQVEVANALDPQDAVPLNQVNSLIGASTRKVPVALPAIPDPIDSDFIAELYTVLVTSGYFKQPN